MAIKKLTTDGLTHLPMDCEAVDDDREALGSRCLAEALHQNENCRCLRVEKTRVVAEHDIVEHDVDVGDFV